MDNNNDSNNNYFLFNKVFKNQYLFYKIYSYVNSSFKYTKFKYEQLISVNEMVKMGLYELIRYKVMKNEYITFGNTNLEYVNRFKNDKFSVHSKNNKKKLYSNINKLEDQYFYQCLFKNYDHYFINELSRGKKKKKEFINDLIKSDCLGGLIVLVNHYQLKIKEYHLLLSFKENSFTIAEYIYSNFNLNTSNDKFLELLKNDIPRIKEYLKTGVKKNPIPVEGKIQFLINVVKLKRLDSTKQIKDIIYGVNKQFKHVTVQELIHICTSISFLELPLQTFIKDYFNHFKEYDPVLVCQGHDIFAIDLVLKLYLHLTIDEIKGIEESIPKDKLQVKLIDLDCKYNSLISPLVKMIGPFLGFIINNFGNFVLYYIRFIVGSLDNIPKDIMVKFIGLDFRYLLEYSQDSSECKINYLKSTHLSDRYRFLNLFMELGDFKCIEFLLNASESRYIFSISLSLLRNNYSFSSFYKTNAPDEFTQLLNNQISEIKSIFNDIDCFLLATFIYDNKSYFANNSNTLENILPNEIKNEIENLSLPQFKLFFQLSKKLKTKARDLNGPLSTLPNCNFQLTSNEKLLLFYYYNNQLTNYINDNSDNGNEKQLFFIENSSLLFSILGRYGDINTITIILSKSIYFKNINTITLTIENNNEKYINYLNPLFLYASLFGQLQVFKLIIDKYPHLFSKKSNIFNVCKRYSVSSDHLFLSDYLNKL